MMAVMASPARTTWAVVVADLAELAKMGMLIALLGQVMAVTGYLGPLIRSVGAVAAAVGPTMRVAVEG